MTAWMTIKMMPGSGWGWVWAAGRVAIASYVGLCLLMAWRQSRYVFVPDRKLQWDPGMAGFPFEEVFLETPDSERLHGWFVPAPQSRGVLLFCHGNAGNISHRLGAVAGFRRFGLDVLIFDYRGYGRSSGRPSEDGLYGDAETAWRYLTRTRGVRPNRVVLYGESLGGAVAARQAQALQPAGLILDGTFTSLADVAAQQYPYFPVRLLLRYEFNTLRRMPDIRCPVLVLHSRQDEIIPFEQGRRLFEAANEPKMFVELRGGHNSAAEESREQYEAGLKRFLDITLGPLPTVADRNSEM